MRRVLLLAAALPLHGGPGATHECFEAFDSVFPAAGIEHYDHLQLPSTCSHQHVDMTGLIQCLREADAGRF